jgi:hypothetical protein
MLWLLYLVASAIMLLNGVMSHAQTVQHYREAVGVAGDTPTTALKASSTRVPEPEAIPEAPQINTEESNQP